MKQPKLVKDELRKLITDIINHILSDEHPDSKIYNDALELAEKLDLEIEQ